jgi:SpoVK/Ycf46/Vps4 family AAA+-type ATPase
MPKRFAVGLPDADQRFKILTLMLKDTPLEPDFPVRLLAQRSVGMSGSDLRELCRNAAMLPVREYVRETSTDQEALAKGQLEGFKLRPLRFVDFFELDGPTPVPQPASEDRSRIDEVDDDIS